MSQSKNKKQPSKSNRNNDEEPFKNKGRRRINWIRVIGLIAALVILISVFSLGFNLFGKVDLSSDNYQYTSMTTEQTSGSGKNTATSKTNTASAAGNTSSASSGDHYVQPAGAEWNLKLVNAWNSLDKNYPMQLATFSGDNQYDSRAADQLRELIKAGSAYNIRPCSLYRTIETQTRLFNNEVNRVKKPGQSQAGAEKTAANAVARPWQSEHNLGLAADLLFENYSDLRESYENTNAYKWMMEHCADYGFILRYPKNKVSVTGVMFEPWHFRYVGEEAAHDIMSRGITLEEYLQEKGK